MLVGTGLLWIITLVRRQGRTTWRALGDRRVRWLLVGGSLTEPFVGIWLSMVAVQNAPVGIASTLMGLSPISLLPLTHWIFQETITPRSILGTVVAVTGVAVIFLT